MLSLIDLKPLKSLLEKTGFSPVLPLPGLNSNTVQAYVEDLSKKTDKNLFTLAEGDELVGGASLETLPFDSELYGFPMAKIGFLEALGDYTLKKTRQRELLGQILEESKKEKIKHLSVRSLPTEMALIHALEETGFYMVAGLSTLALNLKKGGWKQEHGVKIRPFKESDLEPLCKISRISFGDPRDWLDKAHADPNLPKDKSDELYVRWFRNCCNGTQADQVLVAEESGEPVGYIALKLEKGVTAAIS